jgi:hypothetical protein
MLRLWIEGLDGATVEDLLTALTTPPARLQGRRRSWGPTSEPRLEVPWNSFALATSSAGDVCAVGW